MGKRNKRSKAVNAANNIVNEFVKNFMKNTGATKSVPVNNTTKENNAKSEGNMKVATVTKLETKQETKTETKANTGYTTTYASWNKCYTKNYNNMGRKNETCFPDFIALCKPSQTELKRMLEIELLKSGYTGVINEKGYLYAKGDIPVLLTAHMDTVHKEQIKDFYEYYDKEKDQHIISSPQGIGGDDRCGVYMILEIIKTHKCSVLFCEDEECGGIGSDLFCKTKFIEDIAKMKYLIELDRANGNDAVFYDCENDDFTLFIENNTIFKEACGSFSDISNLSPACGVASVNFSCGYYNAHTPSEYVIMEEMLNTIEQVKKLLEVECEAFEYIEKVYTRGYNNWGSYYGSSYGTGSAKKGSVWYDKYDDDRYWDTYYGRGYYGEDDDYYDGYSSKSTSKSSSTTEKSLFIYIYNEESGTFNTCVVNAESKLEAMGKFFMENSYLCFDDVYDYQWYDVKMEEEGWYKVWL